MQDLLEGSDSALRVVVREPPTVRMVRVSMMLGEQSSAVIQALPVSGTQCMLLRCEAGKPTSRK